MRKALSPTAWDASNVSPASNWPINVEPMQVTKPASSPADEAGPLGARNSWLVDLGTGVQGRKARAVHPDHELCPGRGGRIAGSGHPVGCRRTACAGNWCQRLVPARASLKCVSQSLADGSPCFVGGPTSHRHGVSTCEYMGRVSWCSASQSRNDIVGPKVVSFGDYIGELQDR